jgi:hypothetical protein
MADRRLEFRLLRRRVSELRFCEVNGRGLASMTGPMNGLGWITERPRTSGRLRVPDGAGRLLTDIEFLVGRLGRIRSWEMVTQSASKTLSLRENYWEQNRTSELMVQLLVVI